MVCENCPTRECLDLGLHTCPYNYPNQHRQNQVNAELQRSVDSINELSERNLEYHRRQRISDQVQECIRRDRPALTCSRSVPPTAKQQNLVQEYLRFNRWVKRPPFTKQGYYLFIRDVVMTDLEFQSNRFYQSGLDEDWIMEFCQNDVWTEEY